jgi:predicted RNase H-like nuclease (RuvC/YqgF family)
MPSVEIKRPVTLRVIVTEQFKEQVKEELREAIGEAQRDIVRLETEGRRVLSDLQRVDLNQAMAARRQLESEKDRLQTLERRLLEQAEDVDKWEMGTERIRGSIEGTVQISPGDDFWQKLQGASIVIRDGIVTEIRLDEQPTSPGTSPSE